jgi:hypothetical protein
MKSETIGMIPIDHHLPGAQAEFHFKMTQPRYQSFLADEEACQELFGQYWISSAPCTPRRSVKSLNDSSRWCTTNTTIDTLANFPSIT